jgi:hypothetical protein
LLYSHPCFLATRMLGERKATNRSKLTIIAQSIFVQADKPPRRTLPSSVHSSHHSASEAHVPESEGPPPAAAERQAPVSGNLIRNQQKPTRVPIVKRFSPGMLATSAALPHAAAALRQIQQVKKRYPSDPGIQKRNECFRWHPEATQGLPTQGRRRRIA